MPELFIVPASPALVAQLAPADAPSARLRNVIRDLLAQTSMPIDAPIDVVVSHADSLRTGHTGSFAAWGAPQVRVGGGNLLGELIVRYLFPHAEIAEVRPHLGALRRTTVVAVDGSAGLSARAPLALKEDGAWAHQWCSDLLAGQIYSDCDPQRLAQAGVKETYLWEELAVLHPTRKQLLDSDDTLGVGRYVAWWTVEEETSNGAD